MMLATEIRHAAKNRDSVGWVSEVRSVYGHLTNRYVIAVTTQVKTTKSKTYTVFPMVSSPVNVCGWFLGASSSEMPPVAMGNVNHA